MHTYWNDIIKRVTLFWALNEIFLPRNVSYVAMLTKTLSINQEKISKKNMGMDIMILYKWFHENHVTKS